MWNLKYFIDDIMTYGDTKENERLVLPTWHHEFMENIIIILKIKIKIF